MRNLFIMHTQYNILSAVAIVQQEYPNDENHLLVSAEFDITEGYTQLLKREFKVVRIIQEHFDRTGVWKRAAVFRRKYKKTKDFLTEKYDRVITAQEQYFDTLIVTKLRKNNPNLIWQSVEEDAYYTISPVHQINQSILRNAAKSFYYKLFLPMAYGKNPCYEKIPCYGSNSGIQTVFLTFPHVARKELAGKVKKEIFPKNLMEATQKLYVGKQNDCTVQNRSIVFLSDLISRYPSAEEIYRQISELFRIYRESGYHLYVKYHPRETTPWDFPEDIQIIPSSYPSELLLAQNQGKDIICIGNASTSIILSVKFGFETFSLIRKCSKNPNKDIMDFYKRIGIKFI